MAARKLDYIDALRGVAVTGTIVTHCVYYLSGRLPTLLGNIVEQGGRGVQLFFVLSAFTLFLSFHQRRDQKQTQTRDFALRRYFRIAPMYYVGFAYAIYHVQNTPLHWEPGDGIGALCIILNLLLLHGLHPYYINYPLFGGWSVGVEILFYCLVPILYRRVKSLNDAVTLFMLSIIAQFVLNRLLISFNPVPNRFVWYAYLELYLPAQFPVFVCGIIAYYLIYTPRKDWYIAPNTIYALISLAFIQLATKTSALFTSEVIFGIASLFITAALSKRRVSLIVNPITRFIGTVSYSAYIIHFPVIYWIHKLLKDYSLFPNKPVEQLLMLFALSGIATILLSTITYHLIEVPFQGVGKRVINRKLTKAEENAI